MAVILDSKRIMPLFGAPGGARFLRGQVPNPSGSRKNIAEGKGVHHEAESEGSRMWGGGPDYPMGKSPV